MYLLAFKMPRVHRRWWGTVLCLFWTLHTPQEVYKCNLKWEERFTIVRVMRSYCTWAIFLYLGILLFAAWQGFKLCIAWQSHWELQKQVNFFFLNLQILKRVAHQYFCFKGFDTLLTLLWGYFSWIQAGSWSMWEWGHSWSCRLQFVRYNRAPAWRRQLVNVFHHRMNCLLQCCHVVFLDSVSWLKRGRKRKGKCHRHTTCASLFRFPNCQGLGWHKFSLVDMDTHQKDEVDLSGSKQSEQTGLFTEAGNVVTCFKCCFNRWFDR